jgi:hypothetical protein
MKDYTFAQKARFVKVLQAQLAALNQDPDNQTRRTKIMEKKTGGH